MSVKLELKNVSFSFGNQKAIENINLKVEEGSFTTLLGPSGCGKTTLLRLISGFLPCQTGSILIDGIDQKGIEVNRREVGFVFQDYALFPHMTVYENVSYGLKIQKFSKNEIHRMVMESCETLGITDLIKRYPSQLSGGQQQRVALARAIVLKPKILLMDEPLSSLDTKLRIKVRQELKQIQQKLSITTIYVTHDQEEALSLSTDIAVLNKGHLLQSGTPSEIYFEPKNRFVADFVGKANFIFKDKKTLMLRPEWFKLIDEPGLLNGSLILSDDIIFSGTVISKEFLGYKTRFIILKNENDVPENEKYITVDFDTIDCMDLELNKKICVQGKKWWTLEED